MLSKLTVRSSVVIILVIGDECVGDRKSQLPSDLWGLGAQSAWVGIWVKCCLKRVSELLGIPTIQIPMPKRSENLKNKITLHKRNFDSGAKRQCGNINDGNTKYWISIDNNNWVFASREESANPLRLLQHSEFSCSSIFLCKS